MSKVKGQRKGCKWKVKTRKHEIVFRPKRFK